MLGMLLDRFRDEDEDVVAFKQFVRSGLLFMFAIWLGWTDVRFQIWGETAEATVLRVRETRERNHVEFQYREPDGTPVVTQESISVDESVSAGQSIIVDFIPGDPSTAVLGHRGHWFGLLLCAFCFFVAGVQLYPLWREARDAANGVRRSRRLQV